MRELEFVSEENGLSEAMEWAGLSDADLLEALKQAPNTVIGIVESMNETFDSMMNSNNESQQACISAYRARLDAISAVLKKDYISVEQIRELLSEMRDITEKISQKDTENKAFQTENFKEKCGLWKFALMCLTAIVTVIVTKKTSFGGIQQNPNGGENHG